MRFASMVKELNLGPSTAIVLPGSGVFTELNEIVLTVDADAGGVYLRRLFLGSRRRGRDRQSNK
jgi:hypothetical protein